MNIAPPSTPLGFGIAGWGNIASHHAKSIAELENCKLIGGVSTQERKRRAMKEAFGMVGFDSFTEMLRQPEIDVICICTPSGYHLEYALQAAIAGKHLIIEKPLEITLSRAREIIKACRENGVKLSCIFQNRFSDDYEKALKAAREGQLGKLILGNAYIKWYRDQAYYDSAAWRGTLQGDGGAALINQGIHTIDLLQNIMGPVKTVFGTTRTMSHNIEGEDLGVAILEFENGALGTIEGSTSIYQGYPERLEIHGTDGSIVLESGRIVSWKTAEDKFGKPEPAEDFGDGSSDPMAIGYQLHKKQILDMANAIWNNEKPAVDGEEGLKSLQIVEAIYQSARTGEKVEVLHEY